MDSRPPVAAVELSDVSVTLGRFQALRGLSLKIPQSRQTVVIGPNGAGKTTLVRTILGQIPHQGRISFSPENPVIGYVPQRLQFDRHLPLTVLEFLALGLTDWPLWLGRLGHVRPRAAELLEQVKAGHLIKRRLGDLSGGELQRVLLASALSLKPQLLILDEPATGVDIYGEQLLCELLDGFKGAFTILMVSHDLPTARAHADWVICLNRRVIAQGPPGEIFNQRTISATFGLHQGHDIFDPPMLRKGRAGPGPSTAEADIKGQPRRPGTI